MVTKVAFALTGIFMLAGAGMMNAPEAAANESACTAPDPEEQMKELLHSESYIYHELLNFQRILCDEEKIEALVATANDQAAPTVLKALESILLKERESYILETAVRGVKKLALDHPSVAEASLKVLKLRLFPGTLAAKSHDDYVRREAVDAIGSIGLKYKSFHLSAFKYVMVMDNDSSVHVRWGVINQVADLAPGLTDEYQRERAVTMLEKFSKDGSSRYVQEQAADTLRAVREMWKPATSVAPQPQ